MTRCSSLPSYFSEVVLHELGYFFNRETMKKLYNDKFKRSVKVGDTIIIKQLAEVKKINEFYKFPFYFVEGMYRFCGRKAKVVEIQKRYSDRILNDFYYWEEPKPGSFAVDLIILDIDGGSYSWSLDMFDWKKNMLIIKNE